jgi:hypothetical protein
LGDDDANDRRRDDVIDRSAADRPKLSLREKRIIQIEECGTSYGIGNNVCRVLGDGDGAGSNDSGKNERAFADQPGPKPGISNISPSSVYEFLGSRQVKPRDPSREF